MKIHLLSDVHLEFGNLKYTPPECDVVVVPGDIHPGVKGLVWAAETYDVPVVAIAGNHEFYNGKRRFPTHYDTMAKKAEELGINFLQNQTVIIGGVRFVGCTLWTDFELVGNAPLMMIRAQKVMNDYKLIKVGRNAPLHPEKLLEAHKESMEFLTDELNNEFDGPTVVVTHHAPSELSVGPRFRADPENAFYATNLHGFIDVMQPTVWVHGHMHSSSDYMISETRIMANPRGYVNRPGYNQDFDPNFVFEV